MSTESSRSSIAVRTSIAVVAAGLVALAIAVAGCGGGGAYGGSSSSPTAGPGLAAAKLGMTKRSDGATEVTYDGHPLYTYVGDAAQGQTNGQDLDDFGAEWYALSAAGDKVDG